MKYILVLISLYMYVLPLQAGEVKRIISLAPSITENLYALGAQNRIVGVTIYCPQKAAGKQKIGTIWEPNIEKIVSLKPDIVFATKEGNKKQAVEKLKSLGIRIETMESSNSFDDICSNLMKLAALVDKSKEAAKIIAQTKQRIADIENKVKNIPMKTVFCQVGAKPLFTISKNTYINEIIGCAGGQNIFADIKDRYPRINTEEVVSKNPQVILIVALGDVTANEKERWTEFESLSAVRSGSIYIIKESFISVPTPQKFADAVEEIFKLLGDEDLP